MEVYIDAEQVYDFVRKISHDPNPIHLKENPIIPGDMLVLLYNVKNKEIMPGTYEFKKALKAPALLEFKKDGIYKEGEKAINYMPQKELSKYKEKDEKYSCILAPHKTYLRQYLAQHFYEAITNSLLEDMVYYAMQTSYLSRALINTLGEPKIAVYTQHEIIKDPKDRKKYNYYEIEDINKKKKVFRYIARPTNRTTIKKEVLVKI